MEFNQVFIPIELIISIMKNLEFRDIKSLYNTNYILRNIVITHMEHIFKNSKIPSLKNIYNELCQEINPHFNNYEKLNRLVKKYRYEKRRLYVINEKDENKLYPYESRAALYGYQKFKNFTKLRMKEFCGYSSFLLAITVPSDKIHLIYFLQSVDFNQNQIVDVITRKNVEDIYCLINLVRLGFPRSSSIRYVDELNFDQIESLMFLKRADFPYNLCYQIVSEYDKFQINRIITLKRSGFNYNNCIRCATQLDEEKFILLMKLKDVCRVHRSLINLVFNTSIRNLNEILKRKNNQY